MTNPAYIPKLLWDADAERWIAADLRMEGAQPMPWPSWLDAAGFPTPRYLPSQAVRFRAGGRWRHGKVVSATMSGGDRMQTEGEDLEKFSYVWGHSSDVQYVIEGHDGELYREVPELRVRDANDR